jgi:hypothetical protein
MESLHCLIVYLYLQYISKSVELELEPKFPTVEHLNKMIANNVVSRAF